MPIYTNKKGLSASWVRAAQKADEEYDSVGWHSVTTLADSPRYKLLQKRHDKEITVDVSEAIFQLLGSAVHYILEMSAEPNVITEQRITVPILGKEISMKADRIEPIPDTHPLQYWGKDYKITKVWAWKHGAKETQIAQANFYRYGYTKAMNLNITKWSLEMLLRDWSKLEAEVKHTDGYPGSEVEPIAVPLWSLDYCYETLCNRVKLYKQCEELHDDDLPPCSEIERWARPEKWAVKKQDGVKALRVYSTETQAKDDASKRGYACNIEHRPCQNVRCDSYCNARPFCNQANGKLIDPF